MYVASVMERTYDERFGSVFDTGASQSEGNLL